MSGKYLASLTGNISWTVEVMDKTPWYNHFTP